MGFGGRWGGGGWRTEGDGIEVGGCLVEREGWRGGHHLNVWYSQDIRAQLLGRQSWQSQRGDIPAVGSQWDKCERHIKQIERTVAPSSPILRM